MKIRKKMLLLIVAIFIVIAITGTAFILTGLITFPRSTKIIVTPTDFIIESGKTITFSARLESDSFILTGKPIYWSASEGSFDKTVGETVNYVAPEVSENMTVTITISFPGDEDYQGVKKTITGVVIPRKAVATLLVINPSIFEIEAGKTIILNAVLTPVSAPTGIISWSLEGPGTLSSTTGATTTYTAPAEIEKETSVSIIAIFPGTSEYSRSIAEARGILHPVGVVLKKATFLTTTPSTFKINSGESIELSAILKDSEGNIITDRPLLWALEGPGTLSSTTGATTTYTAPAEVKDKITIRITVAFEGDEKYAPSKSIVIGEIEYSKIKVEDIAYMLTFTEAILEDVKAEGPIEMYGTGTIRISAKNVIVKDFSLSRLGLKARSVQMSDVQLYVTQLTAYSPELKEALTLRGDSEIFTSHHKLTLERGTTDILQLTAELIEFSDVEVHGEYIGGEEPYMPTIVNVPIGKLSEGYFITTSSLEGLEGKVHLFTFGRAQIKDFSLAHPVEYYLDRIRNSYTLENRWNVRASDGTFINATIYSIYINFKAYNLGPFIFTGEDLPALMGMERGEGGPISDGIIHIVHGKVEKIIVEKAIIDIVIHS
ncbi:MAG: hypothetical protein QXG12_04965 [Thermoproteota archaeon]